MAERAFRYTDRWGAQVAGEPDVERFLGLYDTIAEPDGDDEHTVVSMSSSDDWYVEASRDELWCGQVEEDGEELGGVPITSRGDLVPIVQEFIDGDFDSLRAREWSQ